METLETLRTELGASLWREEDLSSALASAEAREKQQSLEAERLRLNVASAEKRAAEQQEAAAELRECLEMTRASQQASVDRQKQKEALVAELIAEKQRLFKEQLREAQLREALQKQLREAQGGQMGSDSGRRAAVLEAEARARAAEIEAEDGRAQLTELKDEVARYKESAARAQAKYEVAVVEAQRQHEAEAEAVRLVHEQLHEASKSRADAARLAELELEVSALRTHRAAENELGTAQKCELELAWERAAELETDGGATAESLRRRISELEAEV